MTSSSASTASLPAELFRVLLESHCKLRPVDLETLTGVTGVGILYWRRGDNPVPTSIELLCRCYASLTEVEKRQVWNYVGRLGEPLQEKRRGRKENLPPREQPPEARLPRHVVAVATSIVQLDMATVQRILREMAEGVLPRSDGEDAPVGGAPAPAPAAAPPRRRSRRGSLRL